MVRTHVSWQWLALPVLLFALLLVLGGWMIAQRNEAGALGLELASLRERVLVQREELESLRSTAGTGRNAVSIERAAQQQLLARIAALESENAALKEDMLLFERLIPGAAESASVRIENFRVVRESDGGFRYRLLIAYQPDRQSPDFRGHMKLSVAFVRLGKNEVIELPKSKEGAESYQLLVRHFLRREGVFQLPKGAEIERVEASVFQGDTLRVKRSAQL
ncbi:MAG: hypothetical protein E6R00_05270 [Gammaproteobacteria bacterium]|nr:MAG: hypothetical protein E6R00_05270 [Gammaproteobacteria bacterium]